MTLQHNILKENISKKTINELQEILDKYAIKKNLDYYVADGRHIVIYKIKDEDKAIRIGKGSQEELKLLQKIREGSPHQYICNVYYTRYIRDLDIYIYIMEYLLPNDITINDIEDHIQSKILLQMEYIYHSKKYKEIDEWRLISYLNNIDRIEYDDEIENKIIDIYKTYKTGDEILVRCIFKGIHNIAKETNTLVVKRVLNDLLKFEKLIKDVYYGIIEYEELGEEHGDISLHNILKDEQGNYKLIDPYRP